jgi:hypothetical protein
VKKIYELLLSLKHGLKSSQSLKNVACKRPIIHITQTLYRAKQGNKMDTNDKRVNGSGDAICQTGFQQQTHLKPKQLAFGEFALRPLPLGRHLERI